VRALSNADFIALLAERGIRLVAEGERLTIRSTLAPLDPETLEEIRARKQELIAHLGAPSAVRVAPEQRVAATSMQQRIWWLSGQETDAGDAYVIVAAYRIRGALDISRWRTAIDAAMSRRDVFVARFEQRQGQLYQYCGDTPPLMGQIEAIAAEDLPQLLERYARKPMSPETGNLVHHGLHRLAEHDHVYVLACHHILMDGRSLELFFDDVAHAYAADREDRASHEHESVPQFMDHLLAEERHNRGRAAASVEYWVERLRGARRGSHLWAPVYEAGPDGCFAAALPQPVAQALLNHARTHSVSRFSLLYAAYKALLRKIGGNDFLIGHPVANRHDENQHATVGCFANTVILRAQIDPDQSFGAFAAQVQAESFAGLDHQSAPLEQVAARLNEDGDDTGDSRPFHAFFALQQHRPPRIEGLRLERLVRLPTRAKFALSLIADIAAGPDPDATNEIVTLHWEYSGDALSSAAVQHLNDRFTTLLEAALRSPGKPLSQLPVFSERDRAIAVRTRAQPIDPAAEDDLVSRFRATSRMHARRLALICGNRTCDYSELDRSSDALAVRLRDAGVVAGEYVGLLMPSGIERIVALVAILKAGAAYVPLPADASPQRQAELRECLGLSLFIGAQGAVWAGLRAFDPAQATLPPDIAIVSSRTADAIAYVNFSSGSTGAPKAIACTDAGVLRLVVGQDYASFDAELVMLCAAPIDFDAFTMELWAPLLNGGTCVIADTAPTPAALRAMISRQHVNAAWLTSALFNTVVDIDPGALEGVRQLLVGGDVVSPEHVARLYAHPAGRDLRIVNGYGPTENTTFTACFPIPRDWPPNRPLPVGRALRGTGLYVLDCDGEPAPHGVIGEIATTGAGLAQGYVGQEAATRAAFEMRWLDGRQQRCYRTGDQGYFDEDGLLHFCGRRDGQVKINGFRVELTGIDSVVRAHPAVHDCASIAVKRDSLQKVVSFVTLRDAGEGWREQLESHVRTHLPSYHCPADFVMLATMPLTTNGKLDRSRLLALSASAQEDTPATPLTPVETRIASVWSELLARPVRSADEDFFRAGGNSLLAMRMLAEVNAIFGCELRFGDMLRAPTLAALAKRAFDDCAQDGAERVGRGSPSTGVQAGTAQADADQESGAVGRQQLAAAPAVSPVESGPASAEQRASASQVSGAVANGFPLSREQQRLWFLHQLRPSSAYNVPLLLEWSGSADPVRLEHALRQLRARHLALRLRIVEREGVPEQHDAGLNGWAMAVEHLPSQHLQQRLSEESRRVLDPEIAPTFSATLLRLNDGRDLLLLNVHHLFFDGHSLEVLMHELPLLYNGDALPEPGADFADVVRWQQSAEYANTLDTARAYWEKNLRGAPQSTLLPFDRNVADLSGLAAQRRIALLSAPVAQLRRMLRDLGVSEFAGWIGLCATVLARCLQQPDIVLATPVANRDRAEFRPVIGFLANTLPLRLFVDEEQSFSAMVVACFEAIVFGLEHQSCPLDALTAPHSDESLPPWSQVLFNAIALPATGDAQPAMRILPVANAAAKYPLATTIVAQHEIVELVVEYDRGRYSEALIESFVDAFGRVLVQVAEAPDRPLCSIDIASWQPHDDPAESSASLPRTTTEFVPIVELIGRCAHAEPNAVAIHGADDRPLHYSTLWQRARTYAAAMRSHGVRRGDRIGLLMQRSDDLPVVLVATQLLGAVYVPLDPKYPAHRIAHILADASPEIVLTDDLAMARSLGATGSVLALEELGRCDHNDLDIPISIRADDLAYIIYTSGSTGQPKGVAIRHESLYWLHRWARATYTRDDLRNVLAATSICFDLSVFEIFMTFSLGGGITVAENVLDLIDNPRTVDVSLINTVPSLLEEVLRHARLPNTVRIINLAGETLQPSLAAKVQMLAPHARIYNLYGPSEDTTYSTAKQLEPGGTVTIGRPIDGTSAYVLDERQRPLPEGLPGELYLGGCGLAAGYFGQPALTAERFVTLPVGRVYRTGDKVRRLPNGELEYIARLDHQCKLRGYRIELGEIERVLGEHPAVNDVCVSVHDLATPEARLVAFVTLERDGSMDHAIMDEAGVQQTLKSFAALRLPTYMLPSRIVILDRMPLTASGKIDRHALVSHDSQRQRTILLIE
jgi:amino acid adenylation domain-containing protein